MGTYVLETHNPEPLISISTRTLLIFAWFFHLSYSYIYSGAYEGGRAPLLPSYPWADGSFNITSAWIYPSQAFYILHFIALHSPKLKEMNYILIHNNTLQSFVWSSIALNIHVSHFEN